MLKPTETGNFYQLERMNRISVKCAHIIFKKARPLEKGVPLYNAKWCSDFD